MRSQEELWLGWGGGGEKEQQKERKEVLTDSKVSSPSSLICHLPLFAMTTEILKTPVVSLDFSGFCK